MTIPFGVVGSVHVTSSKLDDRAVTFGGLTPLGAVKERHVYTDIVLYYYMCIIYVPASPLLPSLHSL